MSNNGQSSISLDSLGALSPRLTPAVASFYGEAACYCLELNGHESGVTMTISGDQSLQLVLEWSPTDPNAGYAHADLQEATEYGACGLALLLVHNLTGWQFAERSVKGTGFDYWLSAKENGNDTADLFQNKCRLEVSGIMNGSNGVISARYRLKQQQLQASHRHLASVVVIVEFGQPHSRMGS